MSIAENPERTAQSSKPTRDPYLGVLLVLLAASLLGTAAAAAGGLMLGSKVWLDAAVTLGISTGWLVGVAINRSRGTLPKAHGADVSGRVRRTVEESRTRRGLDRLAISGWIFRWVRERAATRPAGFWVGASGAAAISVVLLTKVPAVSLSAGSSWAAAALWLVASGLAATAAGYLADIDQARFPEGQVLARAARLVAWVLVVSAASTLLMWAALPTILRIAHGALVLVNVLVCYELLTARRPVTPASHEPFPPDLRVLSMLGSRPNMLASVLDSVEGQLGIDLRSTWALTVVRRSLEPLVIGLCLAGWLSTSLTVVGPAEQGLVERIGVPLEGEPLMPGLHLHWPWPVDQVFRVPVLRVQTLTVGHEGEARTGPEDVLWTVEHVPNEYTLLLGDGRDLITVDAAVQFRIADARAWRYRSRNPAAALRAIAYRAVMRSTVNRTLSEALSENVVTITERMRGMVQREAAALGLGVEIVGFTIRAMHPPVQVADAYEAVVSAELGRITAAVSAQAFRNQAVPAAEAAAAARENLARAEGSEALARAAGEAWSFRTLESQYRAAPREYVFRRRLETLETGLALRRFTIVDARLQRDGGELWLTQ